MTEKDILLMIKNKEIELWTSKRVSRELKITPQHANRLMRMGRIVGIFIGGIWLTVKSCVEEFKNG